MNTRRPGQAGKKKPGGNRRSASTPVPAAAGSPSKSKTKPITTATAPATALAQVKAFDEILVLIQSARTRALAAVNTALIELYWSIGAQISRKTDQEGWGQGTVKALAHTI